MLNDFRNPSCEIRYHSKSEIRASKPENRDPEPHTHNHPKCGTSCGTLFSSKGGDRKSIPLFAGTNASTFGAGRISQSD